MEMEIHIFCGRKQSMSAERIVKGVSNHENILLAERLASAESSS